MKNPLKFTFIFIILHFSSCQLTEDAENLDKKSAISTLSLQEIEVPKNVFSLLNEVIAYQVLGETEMENNIVPINLKNWSKKRGVEVNEITVLELSDAQVIGGYQYFPDKDISFCLHVKKDYTYLIYPSFKGYRLKETYQLLCELVKIDIETTLRDKICELIYCENNPGYIESLVNEFPELEALESSNLLFGGLGGLKPFPQNENICDRCTSRGGIIPRPEEIKPCGSFKILDPCGTTSRRKVIYERDSDEYTYGEGNRQKSQIHLWEEGVGSINLSNNSFNDIQPNVSSDGNWVVFASERPEHPGKVGLYLMKTDGSQQRHIPKLYGGNPVFGKVTKDEAEIFYVSKIRPNFRTDEAAFYGDYSHIKVNLNTLSVQVIGGNTDIYGDDLPYLNFFYPVGEYAGSSILYSLESDRIWLSSIPNGQDKEVTSPLVSSYELGITMHQSTGKFVWTYYDHPPKDVYFSVDQMDNTGFYNNLRKGLKPTGLGNYFAGFDYHSGGYQFLASSSKGLGKHKPMDFDVYTVEDDLSFARFLFGEENVQERWPNFLE